MGKPVLGGPVATFRQIFKKFVTLVPNPEINPVKGCGCACPKLSQSGVYISFYFLKLLIKPALSTTYIVVKVWLVVSCRCFVRTSYKTC